MSTSRARALAITIGAPLALALVVIAPPGVSSPPLSISATDLVSVFALGVTPIISAYVLVEVVAFLVPSLSRLRHDNPAGRSKLERAAWVLATIFGALQAFGMSLAIEGASVGPFSDSNPFVHDPGWAFRGLFCLSMLGGVAVTALVARWISSQGLANGLAILSATGAVRASVLGLLPTRSAPNTTSLHEANTSRLPLVLASIAVMVAASVFALLAARPARSRTSPRAEGPYRSLRQLLVKPVIAIPTGTLQSIAITTGAVALARHTNVPGLDGIGGVVLTFAIACVVNYVVARIIHRPAELQRLMTRAGGANGADGRAAIDRAWVPSVLFILAWTAATSACGTLGVALGGTVALCTAIAFDVVVAWRASELGERCVVWEDRRLAAVHAVRAAMREAGLNASVGGASLTALFGPFVPYSPAQIVVPAADREPALAWIARLLAKDEQEATAQPLPDDGPFAPPRRRTIWGIALVSASSVLVLVTAWRWD